MTKGRLEKIFGLDETEDSQQLPDALPLPTLKERVNIYLNAVHGPREFTSKERQDARDVILDSMASSLREQRGSENELRSPHSGVTGFDPYPAFAPTSAPRRASLSQLPPPAPIKSYSASMESLSSLDLSLHARAPRPPARDLDATPSVPRTTRRFTKRTVITFAAMAATVAIAMPSLLSTNWFSEQKTSSNVMGVAANLGAANRKTLNLNTPVNSQMNNVPSIAQPEMRASVTAPQADSSLAVRQLELVDQMFASGNVPRARSKLTDAANRGDAAAAFALAATFDPIEIERLGRTHVTPDISAARAWYQKAYSLGSTEAKAKLQRLSERFPSPEPK